ncbi:MAG: hypothetical protein WB687_04265 [Candidatus Cybelea sp.]
MTVFCVLPSQCKDVGAAGKEPPKDRDLFLRDSLSGGGCWRHERVRFGSRLEYGCKPRFDGGSLCVQVCELAPEECHLSIVCSLCHGRFAFL